MIYTVKTVVGRENIVIDAIASKAKSEGLAIQSVFHPEEIRGYVFIEGEIKDVEKVVQMIPHVRGLIKKAVDLKDIQKFLQPRTVEIEMNIGDVVEVIGGPFKGERGKVTRYDKTKREVTIELIEAVVPIPITVSVEFLKLLEKAGKSGK
jgi:transcriptional antiterminator NusG